MDKRKMKRILKKDVLPLRKMKKIPKKIQDNYWIYGKYVITKYDRKTNIYIDGIKLQTKSSLSDAVEFIDLLNKKIG